MYLSGGNIDRVWACQVRSSMGNPCTFQPILLFAQKGSKNKVYILCACFRCVWLFVTPWTVACQAHLSMRFSRQEHWSGLPCPPPGDLPNPWLEPVSLMSPELADGFFTTSTTSCINIKQLWTLRIWAMKRKGLTGQVSRRYTSLWQGLESTLHCSLSPPWLCIAIMRGLWKKCKDSGPPGEHLDQSLPRGAPDGRCYHCLVFLRGLSS